MMTFLSSKGAVHKRRRQLRGVKNWSKLPMDSIKKTADMGEGGVKNLEKLPTSFMDAPLSDNKSLYLYDFSGPQHYNFLQLTFKIKNCFYLSTKKSHFNFAH